MQNPNKLNIHFILHEAFEVPGAYLKWAQWRGHNISATKVYEREALPDNVDDIDFLIVMGGPQSPDEDRQAFPYYDPQSELRLMRQAMAADKYIVGVCLGAQRLCWQPAKAVRARLSVLRPNIMPSRLIWSLTAKPSGC